jgi:uncharacterized protein
MPSFNCANATYPDERAICSSTELSKLDTVLAAGYEYVRIRYGDQYATSVNAPLFQARRACGADLACIKERQLAAIKIFQRLGAPSATLNERTDHETPASNDNEEIQRKLAETEAVKRAADESAKKIAEAEEEATRKAAVAAAAIEEAKRQADKAEADKRAADEEARRQAHLAAAAIEKAKQQAAEVEAAKRAADESAQNAADYKRQIDEQHKQQNIILISIAALIVFLAFAGAVLIVRLRKRPTAPVNMHEGPSIEPSTRTRDVEPTAQTVEDQKAIAETTKVAADRALDTAATERATAEKATAIKEIAAKAAADKVASERAVADERAAQAKAAADKVASERAAAERVAAERALAEKAALIKKTVIEAAADTSALVKSAGAVLADKAAAMKAAAEKAAAERAAADRAAADKTTKEGATARSISPDDTTNLVDQLAKFAELRANGTLTEEEFKELKTNLIGPRSEQVSQNNYIKQLRLLRDKGDLTEDEFQSKVLASLSGPGLV